MNPCAIVPAYDAAATVGAVARDLMRIWPRRDAVFVVDDGSRDGTAAAAREAGAIVLAHATNRGKGAALRTGMEAAWAAGFDVAVTVDADGQHPAAEALRLIGAEPDPGALVLGVRDLLRDGAPRANRISNGISNAFLSLFTRRLLRDTQCGLRRYPVRETLDLGASARGYAFEAEVVLRAIARGLTVVELPIDVVYPPEAARLSHFRRVLDPTRIVLTVVRTVVALRWSGR